MNFIPTPLEGAFVIELSPTSDNRGLFVRGFCKNEFKSVGLEKEIVQINHSLTKKKGAFRGLHYQNKPFAEIKMVRCIRGAAIDVIVDIRKDSPTFLNHFTVNLTEDNFKMIYIPEGFAHGFQTLEDNTELLYLHTEFYVPKNEGALNINDPILNISLPLPIVEISNRDVQHPFITNDFKGI